MVIPTTNAKIRRMIYRYFDNGIIGDIVICFLIYSFVSFFECFKSNIIQIPSVEQLEIVSVSIITISAALIGFLLTIITVLVTFRNSFEKVSKAFSEKIDEHQNSEETIFDDTNSMKQKFYNYGLHRKVSNVFFQSAFELGSILFLQLFYQMQIFNWSTTFSLYFLSFSIVALLMTMIRSLYVFKLFLNVHL